MNQVPSYVDILHVGHRNLKPMWDKPVEIQEKVDGSQISFMKNEDGELLIRSKGQQIYEDSPSSKMFQEAVDSIKERQEFLRTNHTYRGEYLRIPKHNTIKYDRIPKGHIVIFDIEISTGEYAHHQLRDQLASDINLEAIPSYYYGLWNHSLEDLKGFLEADSFLGGSKIEGVVVKSYSEFDPKGKPLMGKLVSDAFKERHIKEWKKSNPSKKDIIEQLIEEYATEARWRKAIQHLRDDGRLDNSPRDIGPLLKEISQDVFKEEADTIKEELFKRAWPQISRGLGRNFPEWFKNDYLLNLEEE